ncbi:1-acyl-sn-glycerol-3-phosphate acyltransferase [Sphaerothrix gracilis]|uniref:lysophospholipid acyltransferase family protein n=1 Tax=Sphaerothrix gracilis TaxID=3151835 RepID=UPI0031FC0E18
MPQSIRQVQPKLQFIAPNFNPWILKAVYWVLPVVMRLRLRPWLPAGISRVEVEHIETLVELYQQFQAGKIRFLMACRHVEVDDPLCGLHLLSRAVPKAAQQQGVSLQQPLHTHFVYERGMTIWGGDWLGWLLSRLGGVPIHRGRRPDWTGLRAARKLMAEGRSPMVVAPEGATNGHSEQLGPLEPGVAQLGFWCVEDLQKANRPEAVVVVPIGIQYYYEQADWQRLGQLLAQLETDSGLPAETTVMGTDSSDRCYQRLLRLGEHLLTQLEQFYSRFYHQVLPVPALSESAALPERLAARLDVLRETALQVAETYFNIRPRGNQVDRCRRLEEVGWMHIYREDITDLQALSKLEQGLADWVAEEASLRLLHMRLVESVVAINSEYVTQRPSFERLAETALLLFDVLARVRGDKLPQRPRLGDRWVQMTIGEPISVSDRWPNYQGNSRAARRAVADLTEELRVALEGMIP